MENDLQIYQVVFHRNAFTLSAKLFHSVASCIDETYTCDKTLDEYALTINGISARQNSSGSGLRWS